MTSRFLFVTVFQLAECQSPKLIVGGSSPSCCASVNLKRYQNENHQVYQESSKNVLRACYG